MSQLLIQHYLNELQTLRRVSGTARESVVSEAFKTMLKDWGKSRDLFFIPQYEYQTLQKKPVYPDGALVHELRVPLGYWEAKDEEDDLDKEIEKKFRKGYPQDNIIFEDSHDAVLIQNKQEVMRCGVEDPVQLQNLLDLFFGYERAEIADFRKAVAQFKTDLPEVLKALREMIETAESGNDNFRQAAIRFLKHAQGTINPSVTAADVREMLIQHILTEEIFSQVFDDSNFHRQNNVAKELYALENTFFTGKVKHDTLSGLRSYYAAIKSAAALVTGHQEKQKFLKTIYENFYKVYDKKKADRLGVVYTPNEIVRFMIESADWLCQKHFDKSLIDKNVEILDPAAGTGTFITELIEHFRGQTAKLRYKYMEELHANEVAILPYYVANLNIETTYAAINGFEEYPNLCFVDTLDNTAGLGIFSGYQHEMFGAIAEENVERIKRQNKKKISVIIGNPPYNAWQENYNSRNPNRPYKRVDERISVTYIREGTARNKNSVYDMYTRFFRWASDRIKDEGVIAFVMGRKPFAKGAYDGYRKVIAREFAEIWILDLGGDVRDNPKLSGTKHNVFGIQTGVAVALCVKKKGKGNAVIHYARLPETQSKDEKLAYLAATGSIRSVNCETVQPDRQHHWLGQTQNDWSEFLSIIGSTTGAVALRGHDQSIFALATNGVETKRDEWVYDLTREGLISKIRFFIAAYERRRRCPSETYKNSVKWDRELEKHLRRNIEKVFDPDLIRSVAYRPFSRRLIYYDRHLNAFHFQTGSIFPDEQPHPTIVFSDPFAQKPWFALAIAVMVDRHFVGAAAASICASRFRWSKNGARVDNITDWALDQFRSHHHYEATKKSKGPITKDAIFHYVYGILHDPVYRVKYALNLKREFPRIPFYPDFWKWAEWGEKLMALHIGYETVEPWPLERIDAPEERSRNAGIAPKAMLRANKDAGNIQLDSETQLAGVPPEAWTYKLGSRSALEWILDQHKEKTPKDPTIREKFNTYRFADYKEKVIDLLRRVTRVSIETMKIVEAIQAEKR